MQRPREPTPGECCGSGCTRCVWDIYYDELAKFEDYLANGGTEVEASASSEEDEPVSYVGSVVVKYLDAAAIPEDPEAAIEALEKDEMEMRDLVPIEKVALVKASATVFDPNVPSISILNLQAPFGNTLPLPGDTVDVLVPNSREAPGGDNVTRLCAALGLDPNLWCELHRSPFVPEESFPPWLPLEVPMTVEHLLSFYVDISSSSYLLHRTFFESLLRVYNNTKATSNVSGEQTLTPLEVEKIRLLEECASADKGAELFRALSNNAAPLCYPSLVDVLECFSFVKIPLDRLLEVSGPLQPRKFSVANFVAEGSAFDHVQLCTREVCALRTRNLAASGIGGSPRRVAELLNEVPNKIAPENSNFFFGHTSHPLCSAARAGQNVGAVQLRKMYIGTSLFGTTSFALRLQAACSAACDVHPARSLRGPLFLVGCGTGIAPLIAAVAQLVHRRKALPESSPPFPCWVLYGGRSRAELLYHEEFDAAMKIGAIAHYECALSREGIAQPSGGKRVTDLLTKHSDCLVRSLEGSGQVFVCGPANALRAVRKLLECDLLAEADDDDSVREQRILLLEEQGKLNFDIWSTGNIF